MSHNPTNTFPSIHGKDFTTVQYLKSILRLVWQQELHGSRLVWVLARGSGVKSTLNKLHRTHLGSMAYEFVGGCTPRKTEYPQRVCLKATKSIEARKERPAVRFATYAHLTCNSICALLQAKAGVKYEMYVAAYLSPRNQDSGLRPQ